MKCAIYSVFLSVSILAALAVVWPLMLAVEIILLPFRSWDDTCDIVSMAVVALERWMTKISRSRVATGVKNNQGEEK